MSWRKTDQLPAAAPPARVEPLDPDSPAGRTATVVLCDLIADVDERLRREGQPVPIDIPA